MAQVTEWFPVIVGVVVFVVATVGLVLALRTEGGRDALAGGAVRFALALLTLAERWIGEQMGSGARGVGRGEIGEARGLLVAWQARRADDRVRG